MYGIEEFSNPERWVPLIPIVVAAAMAIYLLKCVFSRLILVSPYRTYIIQDLSGKKRVVQNHEFLWRLWHKIVRGNEVAQRFEFAHMNSAGEMGRGRLMDPKTGRIDLRKHSLDVEKLEVPTADGHTMAVDAELRFQLNLQKLKACFIFSDFGQQLTSDFKDAVSTEIFTKQNEDVYTMKREMEQAALSTMREAANALGIIVHGVSLDIRPIKKRGYNSGEIMVEGASSSGHSSSWLLNLETTTLDDIRDVFRNRDNSNYQEKNEALLRILEMLSRENIAHELGNSKGGFIVPAEELGIVRTALSRDARFLPAGLSEGVHETRERDDNSPTGRRGVPDAFSTQESTA